MSINKWNIDLYLRKWHTDVVNLHLNINIIYFQGELGNDNEPTDNVAIAKKWWEAPRDIIQQLRSSVLQPLTLKGDVLWINCICI